MISSSHQKRNKPIEFFVKEIKDHVYNEEIAGAYKNWVKTPLGGGMVVSAEKKTLTFLVKKLKPSKRKILFTVKKLWVLTRIYISVFAKVICFCEILVFSFGYIHFIT